MHNEIVIISGKGGTGKTTLTSSLMPFLGDLVIADCDVDAPDLDILLKGNIIEEKLFIGLKKPQIENSLCTQCGKCLNTCNFEAIGDNFNLDTSRCEGCGVCELVCDSGAITMVDHNIGSLYHSKTCYGDMIHARLIPGEEASGKLVAKVRREAKLVAKDRSVKTILVDGSPGLACNVISSITGATKVVIVTEPSIAGIHDLKRLYELLKTFNLKVYIVINKFDISTENTEKIIEFAKKNDIFTPLKVPFDRKILDAVLDEKIPSILHHDLFSSIGFFRFTKTLLGD